MDNWIHKLTSYLNPSYTTEYQRLTYDLNAQVKYLFKYPGPITVYF